MKPYVKVKIRRWVYRRGYRPKPGSVFFSPGLDFQYRFLDALALAGIYQHKAPVWQRARRD